MFLRKLTVICVPLLMCFAVCLLLNLISGLGFFSWVIGGTALGAMLALLLPLSGASRRREPFGGLLWIPALLLAAVLVLQYLHAQGTVAGITDLLATDQGITLLAESAFCGFMITTCLRTRT